MGRKDAAGGVRDGSVSVERGVEGIGVTAVHDLLAILAVMNPVANVPVFVALTGGMGVAERRAVAVRGVTVACGIVLVFALLGHVIFALFGITLDAFRVAGGALLFVIAFGLLQGQGSHVHHPRADEQAEDAVAGDVAVTPLGTPVLAGPGTLATVLALGGEPPVWMHTALVVAAFAVVIALTALLFRHSEWVTSHLGQVEINVVTRMMGLLLTIVAVQMAAAGLVGLFPGLA